MPKFLQEFRVDLVALGTVYPLRIPTACQEVALRVYDKYVPPAAPPPPSVGVIAVAEVPPPTLPAWTTRFFELVQDGEVLPDTFLKYIGTVPFGPEKEPVHIIEVSS
jgi:hypothetical protein